MRVRRRTLAALGVIWALLLLGFAIGLSPYFLRAKRYDLRKLGEWDTATIFFDRNGEEIGRLFVENRVPLPHSQIPDFMRKAVIAAEDKRFYAHPGIDGQSVLRALWANIKAGARQQGGSTITQQLAKHLIGNFQKTIDRKLVEAFLALRIEKHFSKDEILDYYLNRIYFGKGYFGVGSAASGYFGKSLQELSLAECALLAGLIKAPTSRSPCADPEKARRWRDITIQRMLEQGLVTHHEARVAMASPVLLASESAISANGGGVRSYFMAWAVKEIEKKLELQDEREIPEGLRVHTTLDLSLQEAAEAEVLKEIRQIERKLPRKNERGGSPGPLQAAAVIMDLDSGAVRTMIGGRDYQTSPFNRATMARRENGCLLHPFLHALAFEKLHLHPASMLDATFVGSSDPQEEMALGNQDERTGSARSFLTAQDALTFANKACAVRIALQFGIQNFANWLIKAGVAKPTASQVSAGWALPPLTLMEIASLYQLMGNGGIPQKAYAIESVVNAHDDVLYQANRLPRPPLMQPIVARQMTLNLQLAAREGTASGLVRDYAFPAPVAGVAANSDGYRDSWFVGYTPGTLAAVWVGFDRSIPIGEKSIAARAALPIWRDIVQRSLERDHGDAAFPVPKELRKVEINRRTGTIRGLGFWTPSAGDIFAYLSQQQLDSISKDGRRGMTQSGEADGSDWLDTMMALEHQDASSALSTGAPVPARLEYRIPALRGDILTSDGIKMATTASSQDLVLRWPSPEIANGEDEVVTWVRNSMKLASEWLHREIDVSDLELRLQYRFQRCHPILVAGGLTSEQVRSFPESALAKGQFCLQAFPKRSYPQKHFFSHGIGYLKRVQTRNRRSYHRGDVIYDDYCGADGLEEMFNSQLTGRDGCLTIATTAEGFARKAWVDVEATQGLTVRTTIDSQLQMAVERSLESIRAGAVVVLKVDSGDIVAMASRPDFDPEKFSTGLSSAEWQMLVSSQKNPLLNRAYRQRQPPGSAFKVVTSLAAMQAGVFDPDRIVPCPGFLQVGNITYLFPTETQSVSFHDALVHSVNTYFMDLGLRAGRRALVQAAHDLGVGRKTGIALRGEAAGLMPDPAFVRAVHRRGMGAGDVANASIGQGDVLVTPLQMANWMAAVANNGTLYVPRIVSQLEDASNKPVQIFPTRILNRISYPEAPMRYLKEAMIAVVEEGTATASQIPGVSIAAKTGTAQVGSKLQPRQIAWIGGYLPADRPQYAFSIMVEGDLDQDLHGGSTAGSLVPQIFAARFKPRS